jgi:hypothetical protein
MNSSCGRSWRNRMDTNVLVALISIFIPALIWYTNWRKLSIDFLQQKIQDLSLLDRIDLKSTDSMTRLKNVQFFYAVFGFSLPIHHMNLILSCFDPSLAIKVYLKYGQGMNFTKTKIERSADFNVWFGLSNFFFYLSLLLFVLVEIWLYTEFYKLSTQTERIIVLALIVATFIIFYFISIFVARDFDSAWMAKRFFESQDEYEKSI